MSAAALVRAVIIPHVSNDGAMWSGMEQQLCQGAALDLPSSRWPLSKHLFDVTLGKSSASNRTAEFFLPETSRRRVNFLLFIKGCEGNAMWFRNYHIF